MTILFYDGRSRPIPEREPGALSEDDFETEFCENLVSTMLRLSPGPGMPDGLSHEAARLYHGTYLRYMSFFAWRFPSWLMSIASKCPYQDVRREIIRDCWDEEVGDDDADGLCHIDLLYDEAEVCGISRQEIYDTKPTPQIVACLSAWDDLTRTSDWLVGYAAIGGLEITQSEPAVRARERMTGAAAAKQFASDLGGTTFHEKLGFPEGALKFFSLHSYKDRFHGGGELKMIVKYANTRERQKEVLWAAETTMQLISLHATEVRRLAREAVDKAAALVGA